MTPPWQAPDVRNPDSDYPTCSRCRNSLHGSDHCRGCHKKDHPLAITGCSYCDREREGRRKHGFCEICGSNERRRFDFCPACHTREHESYVKGCERCETRAKNTYEPKYMRPGRRAVTRVKNAAIVVAVVAGIVGVFLVGAAIDKAGDESGERAASDYACAAVRDYVNGDDMSDVLGDLQRRMDDADYAGEADEVASYQSAYDVIAFGEDWQLANWVEACS